MTKDLSCAADGSAHPSEAHKAGCPVCNPTKTVPELNQAYAALTSKQQLENANILWQEVDRQLKAGIGVPSIALNRVHWCAAIEEVERLREERRVADETSDKPVAWRYLADSAYEQRPRWVYFEENTPTVRLVAEGRTLEPLYSRGSPEEPKAERLYNLGKLIVDTARGSSSEKASASHVHVWEKRGDFGGASCKCGTRADGWYCPDSPDHLCHYEKGNFDQCDFCGLPEERK